MLLSYPKFPISFFEEGTPVMRRKDRRQETQNIKLCLAPHWLFDVTLLIKLEPFRVGSIFSKSAVSGRYVDRSGILERN